MSYFFSLFDCESERRERNRNKTNNNIFFMLQKAQAKIENLIKIIKNCIENKFCIGAYRNVGQM